MDGWTDGRKILLTSSNQKKYYANDYTHKVCLIFSVLIANFSFQDINEIFRKLLFTKIYNFIETHRNKEYFRLYVIINSIIFQYIYQRNTIEK